MSLWKKQSKLPELNKFFLNVVFLLQSLNTLREFESLAIGVMNVFDANTKDTMNCVIMQNNIPFILNCDCLNFAVECECKRFVALGSVQNVITELWYRKLIHKAGTRFKLRVNHQILLFVC